jgi:hypothetical protein
MNEWKNNNSKNNKIMPTSIFVPSPNVYKQTHDNNDKEDDDGNRCCNDRGTYKTELLSIFQLVCYHNRNHI